ncbi:MAG: sugar phosphate nucleotidyltransferase, partial [Paracoccaceae bacterium]
MITPVILCGGSGTRLWPVSRKSFPKQFVPLTGRQSLFAASALRLVGPDFAAPLVVTGSDFRFIVAEQMLEAGVDPGAVLIEPDARNTAPAVLAACLHIAADDPDGLILITPSDHAIADPAAFRAAVARGVAAARSGQIVTFGILPTHAETGYGWLELSAPAEDQPVQLRRFVEKPDAATAEAMLAAGTFLWNAGIFLFTARTMIAAFEQHAPDLMAPV